jgi:hypothetical protein
MRGDHPLSFFMPFQGTVMKGLGNKDKVSEGEVTARIVTSRLLAGNSVTTTICQGISCDICPSTAPSTAPTLSGIDLARLFLKLRDW